MEKALIQIKKKSFYFTGSMVSDLKYAICAFVVAGILECLKWIIPMSGFIVLPFYALGWWGVRIIAKDAKSNWLKILLWIVVWGYVSVFIFSFFNQPMAKRFYGWVNVILFVSSLGYFGKIKKVVSWAYLGFFVVSLKLLSQMFNIFFWLDMPFIVVLLVSINTIFFCKLLGEKFEKIAETDENN